MIIRCPKPVHLLTEDGHPLNNSTSFPIVANPPSVKTTILLCTNRNSTFWKLYMHMIMGSSTLWFLAYSCSIQPSWFMHVFTDIRISLGEQILVYYDHSPHDPSLSLSVKWPGCSHPATSVKMVAQKKPYRYWLPGWGCGLEHPFTCVTLWVGSPAPHKKVGLILCPMDYD